MSRQVFILVLASGLAFCAAARGDFKYTQTSQMTGGAMTGMMKGMGAFSKKMRQAMKPMQTTTSVKGDYLRTDNPDGTYQIIDLNGQRIIQVDPNHKTYSVATFAQMRAAIEKIQQRMNEAMRRNSQANNTAVPPKIEVTSTGKTQILLGQTAQEVDIKMAMQVPNPQQASPGASFNTDVDTWVAPSVSGYGEVSKFYARMAAEVGWTPSSAFGNNPSMMKSMIELTKSGKIPTGLPLLTTFNMLGGGVPAANTSQSAAQPQPSGNSFPGMGAPGGMAAKALGGMFGGFGRHKKKKQASEGTPAPPTPPPGNVLMSMTTRVLSFSTNPLDASLFDIPAGFTKVQSNFERILQGNAH